MTKIDLAIAIARKAHRGQKDKLGSDYIDHPLRVLRNLRSNPNFLKLSPAEREDAEIAAILHDVIEDSGKNGSERFNREDLMTQGFSPRSIELVALLTRSKAIPDHDYYQAIANNPLAKLVKLADIADNRNVHRVAKLSPEDAARLNHKYTHALDVISVDEADSEWMETVIHYDIELDDVEDDAFEDEG